MTKSLHLLFDGISGKYLFLMQVLFGTFDKVIDSVDMGAMQINSYWLPVLARYDITRQQLIYDSCANVKVGAWILAQSIAERRNIYEGLGDYNSRTTFYNVRYQYAVRKDYMLLAQELCDN